MTILKLSHWRQTTGRDSRTLMEIQGQRLDISTPIPLHSARGIMSSAVRVMQDGTKHVFQNAFAVYLTDESFVVESVPAQPDQWGRESPIITHGSLILSSENMPTGRLIVDDISRFASEHELGFKEGQDWSAIIEILDKALKKKGPSGLSEFKNWKLPIIASNLVAMVSMILWAHYGLRHYLILLLISLLPLVTALLVSREKPGQRRNNSD